MPAAPRLPSPGRPSPGLPSPGLPSPGRPTREAPYVHAVHVRYGETDQMGVVHHANFLLYLEDARTSLLRDRGIPYSEVEREGVGLPIRNVQMRYKSPGLFEDDLLVSCWIERTRSASVTFGYEVHRQENGAPGTLLLTAELELACIDLETRRPRVFPDSLKRFFLAEE